MHYRHSFPKIALTLIATLAASFLAAQSHPANYNNEGVAAYKAGNFAEAIRQFEQAYKEAPDSAVVRRNLCNAYQSEANALALNNDFRNAIRYVEAAIDVDPRNPSPVIQLGSYYLRTDNLDAAINRLEEAIVLKPGDLTAHELLGQAYYQDNDLSSARAQWDYVLEIEPNRPGLNEKYEKAFREESVEYDFNRWKSRHFRISYPPKVPASLRSSVFSILDRAYVDIGRQLGGIYPPPPIHVILYTAEQFSEATQLEGHVGAVYDGKIRAPLTDSEGNWLSNQELERRLTHEYVHVAVRHVAGANIPWWLNEGLAETLSKSLSNNDVRRLREHFNRGGEMSLASLEANQINRLDPSSLRLAYLKSHATVTLLWDRYGRNKMIGLLRALGDGMGYESALQATYRRGYALIERDVTGIYR